MRVSKPCIMHMLRSTYLASKVQTFLSFLSFFFCGLGCEGVGYQKIMLRYCYIDNETLAN